MNWTKIDIDRLMDTISNTEWCSPYDKELAIELINKIAVSGFQEQAKEPTQQATHGVIGKCPACNSIVTKIDDFCMICGQTLMWEPEG